MLDKLPGQWFNTDLKIFTGKYILFLHLIFKLLPHCFLLNNYQYNDELDTTFIKGKT
jgi:hypothetical protein